MQRYVDYLLEDIDQAKENVPIFYQEEESDMFLISVQEERVTAPVKPLGEWLQLDKIIFPPTKKLNELQLKSIMLALEDLLLVYNYIIYFPLNVTLEKKYEALITHFDEPTPFLTHNFWQLNFCDNDNEKENYAYDVEDCSGEISRKRIQKLIEEDEWITDVEELLEQVLDLDTNAKQIIYLEFEEEDLNSLFDDDNDDELLWLDDDMDEDINLGGSFEFWEDEED